MPLVWNAVNIVVSLAVITALFTLLYPFLPDVKLRWRDVVVGAFVTAVLFSIGKQLIGLYLGRVRPHPPTARPGPSLCSSLVWTTRLRWCCSAQSSRASTRIMKGGGRDRRHSRRRIRPPQKRRREARDRIHWSANKPRTSQIDARAHGWRGLRLLAYVGEVESDGGSSQSLYHAPPVLAGRDSHRCLLLQPPDSVSSWARTARRIARFTRARFTTARLTARRFTAFLTTHA